MLTMKSAGQRGREAGYRQGYDAGYNQGFYQGCRNFTMGHQPLEAVMQDVRVMYVTAGIGVPYPAIDQAIIGALAACVSEVEVVSPADNVAEKAQEFHPQLVLVLNGVVFPPDQLLLLKQQGIKTAVWFTDDPYYTDWTISIAPNYDMVFTLEIACVSFYQELGCKEVYYLPFGVNTEMFHPKDVDASYHSDICFIGTAFWNRIALFDQLASFLHDKKVIISGWWWDRLQSFAQWGDQIHLGEWLNPEETANYYNGAKIVINLHRDVDDSTINVNSRKVPALSINPRTFEIAACGTIQLTDERQETGSLYRIDEELATFSSVEELTGKITYYLKHEEERKAMALNGLRRTVQDHTYLHRVSRMMSIVLGSIGTGSFADAR